jgi:hypothetical protein
VVAAQAHPDGAASHRAAVLLHGLPLVGLAGASPTLTVPPRSSGNRPGVKTYRAALRPEDLTIVAGTVTTSVARTLIDQARHEPIARSVACIDAALNRGLVSYDELDDVLRFCWNWPRIRRAQRAAFWTGAPSRRSSR